MSENEQLRLIVRDEANKLLLQHLNLCPFVKNKIEERTRKLETNTATLFGFMAGSGFLGGAIGGVVSNFLS